MSMPGGISMCELSVGDERLKTEHDEDDNKLARQFEQLERKLGAERDDGWSQKLEQQN